MTYLFSYEDLKAGYEYFKQFPPRDMFEKCAEELKYVRNLIQHAKIRGLEKDVFEYQQIEKEDIEQLKAMGYNVK